MKFLGFDVTFAFEAVSDVYHLMKAYKKMTSKKGKKEKEKVAKAVESVVEEATEGAIDG